MYNVKNTEKRDLFLFFKALPYISTDGMVRFACRGTFMNTETKENEKKKSTFKEAGRSIKAAFASGTRERGRLQLVTDVGVALVGFLFGGCHLIFGSYPLGLALVSAIPKGVFCALLGVALGSLLLGRSGIVYAMIALLSVFIRIIICGGSHKSAEGDEKTGKIMFGESVGLRICAAVICAFVSGIYEILLNGISGTTVLFFASMVVLSAACTLLFSGAFYHGIGVKELIFGGRRIFACGDGAKDKLSLAVFRCALLGYIFFISLGFGRFNVFGVDLAFVFSGVITLFVAKRFGPLYAAVVGFFSSFGISGVYSLSFVLAGAAAGAVFSFGALYAVAAGGILLAAWGAYLGGVSGFLSVIPEYLIAAAFMSPISRYLERESAPERRDTVKRRATDMVGTMALAYRNEQSLYVEATERALAATAPCVMRYTGSDGAISMPVAAKLLSEAGERAAKEREMDEELSERLSKVFSEYGFSNGVIRAFGDKRKHFICSGEDRDGDMITSPVLRREIEACAGVRLCEPEYYRREEMVLMVSDCKRKYTLTGAYAAVAGGSEVSGDSVRIFESEDGMAHGIISDGMGSGDEAKRTSEFVCDFFENMLASGGSVSTLMHALNSIIQHSGEECGATVDLFSLDLFTGEAAFVKSGAAPSFIKRGSSLFCIRSGTLPVGLMSEVNAECISAATEVGDHVIMLSDGVVNPDGEAPWLIELLNKPIKRSLKDYATAILDAARENSGNSDDKCVAVLKIQEAEA